MEWTWLYIALGTMVFFGLLAALGWSAANHYQAEVERLVRERQVLWQCWTKATGYNLDNDPVINKAIDNQDIRALAEALEVNNE